MKMRSLTAICGMVGLVLGGLINMPQPLGQTKPPDVTRLPPANMSTGAFGGAVNAYTMPAPVPPITTNIGGYRVCGSFPAGVPINTGDSTLAAGTAPPLPIRKNVAANPGLVQLTGGDVTGQVQSSCFQTDGPANFWIMQDQPGSATVTDFNGTVSAVDWLHGTNYRYLTGGKTLTLPAAGPGISPNGYILITTPGGSVGLKASGSDVINNGITGASGPGGTTTIPQGLATLVQTSGVAGPTAYSVPLGTAGGGGGGGGFTSVGNIVPAGWLFWYSSSRAFSDADRGNRLMNVCNVGDAFCADVMSDATTGAVAIPTIGGSDCSTVTCTIKIFYDRSGNARDAIQATITSRATLAHSGCPPSTTWCASFAGNTLYFLTSIDAPQPYSNNVVVKCTTRSFAEERIIGATNTSSLVDCVDPGWFIFAGSNFSVAGTTNTWNSISGVYNHSASIITLNGVDTTNFAGDVSSGNGGTQFSFGAAFNGTLGYVGLLTEVGQNSNGFAPTDRTGLNSNQRAFYGF